MKIKSTCKVGLLVTLLLSPVLSWAEGTPTVDTGATAWMLTSTALVLLMVPGLAMFYGGLVRQKNMLSVLMQTFMIFSHSFSGSGVILPSLLHKNESFHLLCLLKLVHDPA